MIKVRQVKVKAEEKREDTILFALMQKLQVPRSEIKSYTILKESLDARKKEEIYFVYEMKVELFQEEKYLKKNKSSDISISEDVKYSFPHSGEKRLKTRPIIVGSGPAGLFAAYFLAMYHYQPLILEQGESIEKRVKTVEEFWNTGKLKKHSNVQFGEGGAGLFSDGKLNTLVKDKEKRCHEVFQIFVNCGAPKEILYQAKPHIGTDLLQVVIQNLRRKIIQMGGTFLFESQLTDIEISENKIKSITINQKEKVDCDLLVLAIGHSARETFSMLFEKGLQMEGKPFAVGVRVQHLQANINHSQYGIKYKRMLPPASYKLTYTASTGRGVYSFCMCPGGYVVNASSEEGELVINGMSNQKRDTKNANSAIVVTVNKKDFGDHPLAGLKYQQHLESLAYQLGKGKIPVQLLKDFKENRISSSFGKVTPIIKGDYTFANLNELFQEDISSSLKEAFMKFDTMISGFGDDDSILAGVESRTSSAVRILRGENLESNILGIYPCGEGAGYSGGITTSCMDGMKVAEQIALQYRPFD